QKTLHFLQVRAELSKFKVCNRPDGDDYSCQAGLSCVQTKLFIMKGQKAYVKQCVPEGMKIDVETVNKDHDQTSRNSRLLPGLPQLPRQSCRSESDCEQNQCCPRFVNLCLPKLPEMAECSLKGCSDLPKLAACNNPDAKDCTCQAGLTCILTKKFIVQGTVTDVKQCMPNSIDVQVETVNMDKNQNSATARMKRFLPLAPCASELTCLPNFCCPRLVQRCLPKLPELATCTLQILHNCGCQMGFECRQTTYVTIPLIGIKVPLLQCVRP
ncbi:unnamed protein product, partial [Porites lobata]